MTKRSISQFEKATPAEIFHVLKRDWGLPGNSVNSGRCRCPGHDGGEKNLSVTVDGDKVLFNCFSHGCSYESILRGAGLWRDPVPVKAEQKKPALRVVSDNDTPIGSPYFSDNPLSDNVDAHYEQYLKSMESLGERGTQELRDAQLKRGIGIDQKIIEKTVHEAKQRNQPEAVDDIENAIDALDQAITLKSLSLDDAVDIDFILDRILERKGISVIFGKPGCGKSTYAAAEIATIASGVDFLKLGLKLDKPAKVGIYWSDEGLNNLLCKVSALAEWYKLDKSVINANIKSIGDFELTMGVDNCDAVAELAIERWVGLDAVYIDSLSTIAPSAETKNDDASRILTAIEKIARKLNIAFRIIHHSRKGPIGETEQSMDAMRGASALLGRASIVEQVVSTWENRTQYLTIGGSGEPKYRNSPRPDARGYVMQSHSIEVNDGRKRSMPVVVPHVEPDAFDDLNKIQCLQIMDAIKSAPIEECRSDGQASGWVGYLVAECLGLDLGPRTASDRNESHDQARIKVKKILSGWYKNHVLTTKKRTDPTDPRKRKFDFCFIKNGVK